MDLNEIFANLEDQDKGREFELADPVTGTPTGIKFRVAGPDSATAKRARLAMVDDLAELADLDGKVSAENREKARINALARVVLGWTVEEDGKPVPFNHANVVRLLRVQWLHAQVDAFADNRAAFRGEG